MLKKLSFPFQIRVLSFAASLITLSFSSNELLGQGQGQGGGGPQLWSLTGNPIDTGDFLGTSNAMPILFKTDDTERMRLLSDGRFGIGTSTPQYLLDVDGRFRALDTSFLNSTFVQGPFYLQDGSQASGRVLTSDANGQGTWMVKDSVNFWSKSGNDLYYDGGRVGIGTASPMRRLDVHGDALVRQQLFVNKGVEIGGVLRSDSSRFGNISPQPGDSAIRVDAETHMMNEACVMNGNFGIGTGSPGSRLTVMGNARIQGTTTTDSLRVNGRTEFGIAQFDSVQIGASSINIGTSSSGIGGAPANTIETDGDEDLFIQTETLSSHHTGNVGVGSGDPKKKLHVKAAHEGGLHHDPEDQFGDHAGIRLENKLDYDGTVQTAEWDITPLVNGLGGSQLRIEKIGGTRYLNINDNGTIDLRDELRIGGWKESGSIQLMSHSNAQMGFLMRVENGSSGLNSGLNNVMHLFTLSTSGSSTTDAIALSMDKKENRSIILRNSGQVGIGTAEVQDDHKLTVNGSLLAKEVVVEDGWPDWVFLPDYELPTLEEEQAHIEEHGHLKDVPSEAEVLEEGLALGDLTKVQQQKVEELYLHLFEMKEGLENLEEKRKEDQGQIELLKEQNEKLREVVEELKEQNEHLKENVK